MVFFAKMSRSQNPREKRVRNAPNDAIRRYLLGEDAVEHEWESRPELPTSDEIMGTDESEKEGDIIQLIPNQITGPWPSKNTYLKGHYELLREDSVAPLRDAVAYARDNPHMMDSSIVAIYEKVSLRGNAFQSWLTYE
jgi:helicase required for RNAi-mediated heterochromatin assembly 1